MINIPLKYHSFLLCAVLIFFTSQLYAQGFLKVQGKQIVNENGENVLLRGIGLGGWMLQEGYMLRVSGEGQQHKIKNRIRDLIGDERTNQFYDAWLKNHTRKIDIDSMKAWGFNSVRLPMHYNLYTLPVEKETGSQQTWLEEGFAMTDSLLMWCKSNGMYLILDLHAAPGGQGTDANISDRDPEKPSLWDSEANRVKTVALWKKLAERYVNEPWMGGYDIINEPNWGFEDYANDKNGINEKKNEPLRKLLVEITNAIREVDKKHIIIIEGNAWGNNYRGMLPPWDNNMVLSFHKYWNYNDANSIKGILETRDQYNVPVWLGETGENSNVWFTQAISLLEKNNIGWAWWPLKKIGINNPLEVNSNPAYDNILRYWTNKGPKPEPQVAFEGLMRLANSLKLEETIFHQDVIDAMMRQPFTSEVKPYARHILEPHSKIEAVNFDLGRNGYAYFDKDSANYWVSNGPRGGNKGGLYRNDAVDIRRDSASNELYVSDIESGEWLQYTVNVRQKGNYTLKLKISSASSEGALSISLSDKLVVPKIAVPDTKKRFATLEVKNIKLEAGIQKLRFKAESGGFNLMDIEFDSTKK